jgi:uncharacterized protein YegL
VVCSEPQLRIGNKKYSVNKNNYNNTIMGLLDKDLETLTAGSGYKFSVTKINALGASEYTLVTIVVDASGSVAGFAPQLEQCLKTVFKACDKSPRRDNLLLRVVQFNDVLTEVHGFKLLGSINESDYDRALNIGGATALFDAADEAVNATATYGKQLTGQDYLCNAIVVVVTDGENNRGNIMTPQPVKRTVDAAKKAENLESIITILVGVTSDNNALNTYLQEVKDGCGFDQYVSIGSATPGKIAKLAAFVSQSISSTSSALGTGAPSQPLNPSGFKF